MKRTAIRKEDGCYDSKHSVELRVYPVSDEDSVDISIRIPREIYEQLEVKSERKQQPVNYTIYYALKRNANH